LEKREENQEESRAPLCDGSSGCERSGCERAQARISADAAVQVEASVDPVEKRIGGLERWAGVD
jgi:hypothetical protein